MRKAIWVSLLILALLSGLLAGCGNSDQSNIMRISLAGEPESLDPRKSLAALESGVERQLFRGLTFIDEHGRPQPDAAESWNVSADGKIYIFHLRKGMKWSDGSAFTARDFEYAWKSELAPKFASRIARTLYDIKNAEAYNRGNLPADSDGIKAIDDDTLQVELRQPAWYFLVLAANHCFYPVSQSVASRNAKWAANPETFVSNGAYKLRTWTHNGKIVLVKNENYYGAADVKLNGLTYVICDNASTAYSMFKSNQLDVASAPPSEYESLKKAGELHIAPQLGTMFLALNVSSPELKDVRIRQALNLAIDRETIVAKVTKLGERAAYGYVPYACRGSNENLDYRTEIGPVFGENVVRAKQLLAAAGYVDGKGLPKLTLLYNNSDYNKAICEAIQEMWNKNLGVHVELQNQEQKVWLNSLRTGDFIITRSGYVGDYTDGMTMLDTYDTTLDVNDSHWTGTPANVRYNALLSEVRASNNQELRVSKMAEAERIIVGEQAVMVPILFYTTTAVERAYVAGVLRAPVGYSDYRFAFINK